ELEMVHEPAIRRDEIHYDSHRVGLGMELRTHTCLDDSALRVARKLPGPLRQALPAHPLPAPAPAQIRTEPHDPPQPVPPGYEKRIVAGFHEQIRARLGIGEDVAAQLR